MYFDNAATSFPKPEAVYQAMDAFARHSAANAGRSGHQMSVSADRTLARARQLLARILNAPSPDRLVWTSNCTEALNLTLFGYLRPGDRVVTTALEHNAVARPLRRLEQRGITLTRVRCPGGAFDLQAFLAEITEEVRLVAMLHASNVTGEVLPIAEVAAHCRERGVRLLVDAAQTAGALPLDLRAVPVDLLAMPGHKGLFGPPGTGALYIGQGVELEPLMHGGTGSVSELDTQPGTLPDRYESGTQNSVGLAGLAAALDWLLETGVRTVHDREMEAFSILWDGLKAIPGVRLHGPPPSTARAAVLSFTLDGWEPTDVAAVLDQSFDIQCRPGLHCAPWAHESLGTFPHGTVRLSPGYFNTVDELSSVIDAVRALAGA